MTDSLKNYLLNKSNRYCYYKSEYMRLKQDIARLEKGIKDLNNRIEEKTSSNIQLKQDIVRVENDIEISTYNSGGHPPGHFYSPINDLDFLKSREDKIWKSEFIDGIELNEEEQIDLFNSFTQYYPELPFKSTKQSDLRYYFENGNYEYGDGTILYSMIRTLTPQKNY